jgi:hypothetical protein
MTAPKILAAWVNDRNEVWLLHHDGRIGLYDVRATADAYLTDSGQRGKWPEGHGVVEIEDIPRPEPLPTAYYWRDEYGNLCLSQHHPRGERYLRALVATVTFDEDDNATVVRA